MRDKGRRNGSGRLTGFLSLSKKHHDDHLSLFMHVIMIDTCRAEGVQFLCTQHRHSLPRYNILDIPRYKYFCMCNKLLLIIAKSLRKE
jgi:hypothetical protein